MIFKSGVINNIINGVIDVSSDISLKGGFMSIIKKILTGFSVAALSAVCSLSVFGTANAADALAISVSDLTIDYQNQTLLLTENSDNPRMDSKIYVSFPTITTKKVKVSKTETKMVTTVTDKTWSIYDYAENMAIDLSNCSVAKDSYIHIKGNANEKPVLIKIPKVLSTTTAVFQPSDATVVINDVTDKKNPVPLDIDKADQQVQCSTTYGMWIRYKTNTDLSYYQELGTTLRFRVSGSSSSKLSTSTEEVLGQDADGEDILAYVADGHFAGKEMKVKIPKKANGPSIKVDYVNGTMTIPVTCEYRVNKLSVDKPTNGEFQKVTPPEGSKVSTILLDVADLGANSAAGVLDVRVAATDTKSASKITEVPFEQRRSLKTVTTDGSDVNENTDILKTVISNPQDSDIRDIEFTGYTKKSGKDYLYVWNNTTDIYQVVIVRDGKELKAINIKAGTSYNGKILPTTTNVNVMNGDLLYVRKSAVAKQKIWATQNKLVGKVILS